MAEGFSRSLDVLYGGLVINKFQFLIKKIYRNFPAGFFIYLFLAKKTLDPNRYSAYIVGSLSGHNEYGSETLGYTVAVVKMTRRRLT
jgi:hypothetical protein